MSGRNLNKEKQDHEENAAPKETRITPEKERNQGIPWQVELQRRPHARCLSRLVERRVQH